MRRGSRLAAWLLAPALVAATWIAFRDRADASGEPARAERQEVRVEIDDEQSLALTTVGQEFVNRTGSAQTASVELPIRDDAAILQFQVTAPAPGKKETPADLGQIRPAGRNLYRVSLSRVPAHGRARFELRYAETITRRGTRRKYVYPIPLRAAAGLSFRMLVRAWADPQNVGSTSFPVTVRKTAPHLVSVTYESYRPPDGHDMVIDYQVPAGPDDGKARLTVVPGADARDDPYCLVTLPTPSSLFHGAGAAARPVDVVFCMDVSGSTEGRKANAIREALHDGLTDLIGRDRFSVIAFDDDTRPFRRELVAATPAAVSLAQKFVSRIRPGGGSEPARALEQAAALLAQRTNRKDRPAIIAMVVDDEDPADLAVAAARLRLAKQHVRLVTLGAMRDSRLVHYRLTGSRIHRGPAIALSRAAITFGASLTSATLDPGTLNASYLYPAPDHLPELPLSTPVLLFGRLNQAPPARGNLVLTGKLEGQTRKFTVEFGTRSAGGAPVRALWANRRVRRLAQLAGSQPGREDLHAAAEAVRSEHGLAVVPGS